MKWLRTFQLRLAALLRKKQLDAEMDEEMRSHIEMQAQENIKAGMKPGEARQAALREFGWVETLKETCRDQRGLTWMENTVRDAHFGVRMLRKNPGFTIVVALTLALGIGANLALFAVLNELLLRPKPVAHPDELWAIEDATPTGQPAYANVCRPYYEAIRRDSHVFIGVIGYADITAKLRTKEGAERIAVELVSGDYFTFLGLRPVLGRGFLPQEDAQMGRDSVAVISFAFWQSQFDGATDVIGRTVTLNGNVVEVVGVAPKGFTGLDLVQPSLWLPTSLEKMMHEFTIYHLVGRLANRKSAAAATGQLAPIIAEVTKELSGSKDPQWMRYGNSPAFQSVRLQPIGRGSLGSAFFRQQVFHFLQFAAIATVLLLFIACANAGGLFLSRALQRRKEMATRLALGATRGVLLRQLVCEGMTVATLAAMSATLTFSWVGAFIVKFASWWPGPVFNPIPDSRVLLFVVTSTIVVGVGFSLFPAVKATGFELFNALKNAEGSVGQRAFLRHSLIVAQMVGSLALLCGATLCLRSMARQLSGDVGFRSDLLVVAPLNLERIGYTTNTATPELAEITRRIALTPGVVHVGVAAEEPFTGNSYAQGLSALEGYRSPDGIPPMVSYAMVGPGVFTALGIPLLRGREMDQTDLDLDRKVVVVNESFVRKFWPDQEPLGKHIQQAEVIGVVKDIRYSRLDVPCEAMMYWMASKGSQHLLYPKLLVRAKRDPRLLISSIRAELAHVHPRLVQGEICTLRDTMKNALAVQLGALRVLSALGGLALAMATIGTYAVMSHLVTRRRREIGVRIALGATRKAVMELVLIEGLRLGLIALTIGLPLTLGVAALLRHQLTGISPFDPVSFLSVTACVLAALVAACWLPACRATRIDPMEALRSE